MALPTKKLIRQADGSLVETPDQGLEQSASELAPSPATPPVTPRGVAGTGAGPDAAKMAGTPAQKQNALAQTVATSADQTLQDRQVGTPASQQAPGATETATRAKELAGGLSTLGSYGARVQGLIKARLDQVESQSATADVNTDAVKTALGLADPDKLALAQQALAAYATSGSEADLAKIRDIFGADTLAAGGLERLYQGTPEALAAVGQRAQGAVTIGQLDLAGGGMDPAQLSQDLGVDQATLLAMTPEQFQQAVQDRLNSGLASVDALKAEYRTASPERQKQILDQLRQADTTGIAAAEASAEHLAESLQKAETVAFAGHDYDIQDLLKSDKVSQLIKDAAANPAALAQLQQTEPSLAAWITRNQTSLTGLATQHETQRQQLEATQTQAAELTKDLTDADKAALKAAGLVLPTGTLTAAQLTSLQQTLAANPVLSAMRASEDVRTALRTNPDLGAQLKDMSVEDIVRLAATSKAVFADPQLVALLHVDPSKGLIDPSMTSTAAYTVQAWGTLPADLKARNILRTPDDVLWAANNANIIESPDIQSLLDDGTLATTTALRQVAAHPQIVTSLKQVAAERQQLDALANDTANPATLATITQQLFGAPLTYDTARSAVTQAMGTPAFASLWKALDLNHDGNFTAADFAPETVASRLRELGGTLPGTAALLESNGEYEYADPLAAARASLGVAIQPLLDKAAAVKAGGAAPGSQLPSAAQVKAAITPSATPPPPAPPAGKSDAGGLTGAVKDAAGFVLDPMGTLDPARGTGQEGNYTPLTNPGKTVRKWLGR